MITLTNIADYLNYDPASGIFTWGQSRSRIKEGEIAGCLSRNGYWKIKFDRKSYFAHRLAWYLYYDEWPKGQIDHINRDKLDNRIENLRDVDRKANCQNRKSFNGGATYHILNKKWQSQIKIDNKNLYLGSYETKEEAQFAFEKAIKEYYECLNLNR